MFERFTDRARKIMALANQEALRLNHHYVGTEHILLGLIEEGSGVGANVLKNLGVDLRQIRLVVERMVRAGKDAVPTGKLPRTGTANLVAQNAVAASQELGHNYVGTEHVLLGLLSVRDSLACAALTSLGLTPEAVKAEALRFLVLGTGAEPSVPEATQAAFKIIAAQPDCRAVIAENVLCCLAQGRCGIERIGALAVQITDDFLKALEVKP